MGYKPTLDANNGIIYNTIMKMPRVVIDTNVLVAALRSKQGASYRLLMAMGTGVYQPVVSVPLVLEYEAIAKRLIEQTRLTERDVDAIIDYICGEAIHGKLHYLWRPVLKDPKDDMVLEAAVAGKARHIATFNIKDFREAKRLGVHVVTPAAFLKSIGVIP